MGSRLRLASTQSITGTKICPRPSKPGHSQLTAAAMDKKIRRVTDLKSQRLETYRYWRSRPCAERLEAVAEIVRGAYLAKGIDFDLLPSSKTLIRVERPNWKAI